MDMIGDLDFAGVNGGIKLDKYGNIIGKETSLNWHVSNARNEIMLEVPLNTSGMRQFWAKAERFHFQVENAESELVISWWSNSGFFNGAKVPIIATDKIWDGRSAGGSGIGFANGNYVFLSRDGWIQKYYKNV